jgi:hypothetical protein
MKKLLFFLLVSTMCFGQSITVENVTLTYEQKTKSMLIVIPPKCLVFSTNDKNFNVRITREYDLVMEIDGVQYSVGDNYFAFSGFTRPNHSEEFYENIKNCKWLKQNYNFLFENVEKGEYILTVTITTDNNKMVTTKNNSIIIR